MSDALDKSRKYMSHTI